MNFRLTAILFGIVFVIGVVLLILSFDAPDTSPTGVLVAELDTAGKKSDDVDEIEFERPGAEPLLIKRTDKDRNTWQIQKPIAAPADASRVQPVIVALLKAKPTTYAGNTGNPAAHGLEPVGLKVTLRAGDKSSTINLGDVTLGDKGVVFVTTSAQPKRSMAVRRDDLMALFREPKDGSAAALAKWTADYRATNVFPANPQSVGEDVASVRLELPNKKQALALTHTASGPWTFDAPANWGDADVEGDAVPLPGTFTGVRRLLGALTSLNAATPADFIDQPKDLKEYGLNADNPDLVKVELKTRDGQSATVFLGKRETAPAAPAMPGAAPQPNSKVYVRVEGLPGVIRATAGDLTGLNGVIADPAPLRDRTLVTVDRSKVDGIDIALPGQPAVTKLRRVGGPVWRLYGAPNDPQPAYGAAVDKFLDVVLARRTVKDFPAAANFPVAVTVSVWVDGFQAAADPKAEPTKKPIKLEFGPREGDSVRVRRSVPDQPPVEFILPAQVRVGAGLDAADVEASVKKTRLDLLDPSLPTFGSDAVTTLTVSGANGFTVTKDEKPDPATKEVLWRYTAPEAKKGQVADAKTLDGLLQLLSTTQSVTRFVDESLDAAKPDEAKKLEEYGFVPGPRMKVVVGLSPTSPDKERVYEFGKDAADPNFVYARVGGRSAVFTLPRLVFDRFVNPDLRDRLVLRAVPATVNKVELRGWGDAGFVTELIFEKSKEGGWVATKAPPGYMADPAKVSAFVDILTRERAKTFEKGVPEGKHGFGDPKASLQVVLHWPGGAVPLTFGSSPDNGASYYMWSGWLPKSDPVFTFDAALLKPFKEKPGGFAK
ncbi:DUF4340 domain-containing protein [Gemmata sp. JC717]|uniref:DUF4340 domain-containing protein n=1 Tax=Gemmata algarum TaxID=2975278 RepID=UPI0021BA4230|nr:DUF4340 domain-containing protein [Gemmata algarum]MDY3554675.1 DUF4340 domain-containing protein [Gemmata algarum]